MTPDGPVITLTTDFGDDAYAAAMKGVVLAMNPDAHIVDISHHVEPQQVRQAAFLLGTAWPYFPRGTIHVVAVDPGVGSQRRALLLATPAAFFLAPDNGVLSYVVEEACGLAEVTATEAVAPRRLCPGLRAVALTEPRFWRQPVSRTFHGRDIFAPVAAHLSLGVPMDQFGEAVDSVLAFPVPRSRLEAPGVLAGHVVYIDRFGNLITDVTESDIASGLEWVEIAGLRISGLSRTYAEGRGLMAVIGSSGRLEVAVRDGSAARLLGVEVGDGLRVYVKAS